MALYWLNGKWIVFVVLALLLSCTVDLKEEVNHVEIVNHNGNYELLLNGEPYFIKGAVAWQKFDLIAAYGGNSIRTGCRKDILDVADSLGLKVLVNLPVRSERIGFDYEDSAAVQKQHDHVIALVDSFKSHPAVLMWSLGNELDWIPPGIPYNRKIWTEVNRMAERIHQIDPHHPAITVIGSAVEEKVQELVKSCPELDLIGLNEYGDILELPRNLRCWGWEKPYIFTEWGPSGFWQVPVTSWQVPIEETSSEKADLYRKRYEEAILKDDSMCLGSFVFLWNQHQERTHTWFGMFDEYWRETEAVDVMRFEWTGEWPDNMAPRIDSMLLDNKRAIESIYLESDEEYDAVVHAFDPDEDSLHFNWEVLMEGSHFPYGGNGEAKGKEIAGLFSESDTNCIRFKTPGETGSYRLFVYVYDGHNHFTTANIPFYIEK
jgi:hypothetical protein